MRHSDSLKTDSQILPVCGEAALQAEKCSEQCHYIRHVLYVYPYVQVGLSNWWYVLPIQVTSQLFSCLDAAVLVPGHSCSCSWAQLLLFLGTTVLMAGHSCSHGWTQLFSFLDTAVFIPGRSCSHAWTQLFSFLDTAVLMPGCSCSHGWVQLFSFLDAAALHQMC